MATKGKITMGLPAKLVHSQLNFFKPLVANCSLETIRRGQDKLGELMEAIHRKDVITRDHAFANFEGAWIIPKDERRQGVILYLHGGGYTCGDLDYAKGFGATLADEEGVRVFAAAYRLAPESPYPAAVEDALEAYNYLRQKGYKPEHIMLCRGQPRAVPLREGAFAAAALRNNSHFPVGGPYGLRQHIRDKPRKGCFAHGRGAGVLRPMLRR